MAFIKVWCEYDIWGNFGSSDNEDVYEVDDSFTKEQIDDLLEDKFSGLFDEIKDEDDENFLGTGLLGWEYINIKQLGE